MKTAALVVGLILLAVLAGCLAKSAAPAKPTSLFEAHCKTCKQCGGGLLDENGQEQSLCEEGFRLFQEDLRRAKRQ